MECKLPKMMNNCFKFAFFSGLLQYEPGVRRRTTPRTQIQQLFPYTPTTRHSMLLPMQLLRSILYGDYGLGTEDINDMFKTTRQLNVKQHPLVNLSFIPIPGVHSLGTQPPARYTTRLTSVLTFPPVPFIFPTSAPTTTPAPSSTSTMSITYQHHITDLLTGGPDVLATTRRPVSPKPESTAVATTTTRVTVVDHNYYD